MVITQDAKEQGSCISDVKETFSLDLIQHLQPHVDTVDSVVWSWHWHSRHAVIAVPEDLDPHTVIVLKQK